MVRGFTIASLLFASVAFAQNEYKPVPPHVRVEQGSQNTTYFMIAMDKESAAEKEAAKNHALVPGVTPHGHCSILDKNAADQRGGKCWADPRTGPFPYAIMFKGVIAGCAVKLDDAVSQMNSMSACVGDDIYQACSLVYPDTNFDDGGHCGSYLQWSYNFPGDDGKHRCFFHLEDAALAMRGDTKCLQPNDKIFEIIHNHIQMAPAPRKQNSGVSSDHEKISGGAVGGTQPKAAPKSDLPN